MASNKKKVLNSHQRSIRTQQIIFAAIGVFIILSMIISLVTY